MTQSTGRDSSSTASARSNSEPYIPAEDGPGRVILMRPRAIRVEFAGDPISHPIFARPP